MLAALTVPCHRARPRASGRRHGKGRGHPKNVGYRDFGHRGYLQGRKPGHPGHRHCRNHDGALDVLQRAAAKGQNLVITHEPTFYNHLDKPEGMDQNDAVWTAKRTFIEKHGLVVWRFHDHWHMRKPDGILLGVVRTLGWEKYQNPANQYLFTMPETTLEKLAREVANRLATPVLRVVGNPEMKVTRVALSRALPVSLRETRALASDNVELLLVGETRNGNRNMRPTRSARVSRRR